MSTTGAFEEVRPIRDDIEARVESIAEIVP
jgi:hypothetical protein